MDIAAPSVEEQDLARKGAVVKLIGISGVHKYHSCSGCKKKIENVDESKKAVTCSACSLFQRTSSISKQWVVNF